MGFLPLSFKKTQDTPGLSSGQIGSITSAINNATGFKPITPSGGGQLNFKPIQAFHPQVSVNPNNFGPIGTAYDTARQIGNGIYNTHIPSGIFSPANGPSPTIGQTLTGVGKSVINGIPVIPGVVRDFADDMHNNGVGTAIKDLPASILFETAKSAQALGQGVVSTGLGIEAQLTGQDHATLDGIPGIGHALASGADTLGINPGQVDSLSKQAHDQGVGTTAVENVLQTIAPFLFTKGGEDIYNRALNGKADTTPVVEEPTTTPGEAPAPTTDVTSTEPNQTKTPLEALKQEAASHPTATSFISAAVERLNQLEEQIGAMRDYSQAIPQTLIDEANTLRSQLVNPKANLGSNTLEDFFNQVKAEQSAAQNGVPVTDTPNPINQTFDQYPNQTPIQPGEAVPQMQRAGELPNNADTAQLTPQEYNAVQNAAVAAENGRYATTRFQKLKSWLKGQGDPSAPLVIIDKAWARANGKDYRYMPKTESLAHFADLFYASGGMAEQFLRDSGLYGLIQKYGEGTPEGQAFMNYLNARFTLEVLAKEGKNINPNATPEQMAAYVRDYEASNPGAIADAQLVKAAGDRLLDMGARAGLLDPELVDYVKAKYQNYVPLARVFSEDLQRPTIGAQPIGSIGKQTFLQSLDNSTLPLDNSFGNITGRVHSAFKQANRQALSNKILERYRQGLVNGDLLVDPQKVAARQQLAEHLDEIHATIDQLKKYATKTTTKARVTGRDYAYAKKAAVAKAREVLRQTVDSPDAQAAIGSLKPAELLEVFKTLVENDTPNIERLRSNLAKYGNQYDSLINAVQDAKGTIQGLRAAAGDVRQARAELAMDPTTGRQTISGFENGQPYKLEVTPELGTLLQGLDHETTNTLLKVTGSIVRVFQTAWTGFINPAFALVSFLTYDPGASLVIGGTKTLRPAAIAEMFRSVNSQSEFQQVLRRNGAQMVGGSQLPLEAQTAAEAIYAHRSFITRLKFDAAHGKAALHDLDVIGGKLANMSRTRIAKAYYDDAINRGLGEDNAIAAAVDAYNNVLPNYRRVSTLVSQLNKVFPYTGATVAGTRSLFSALRNDPMASARLVAVGILPTVASTAYSLSLPEGQQFYDDMLKSGRGYQLDNNLIIVLPGAYRDSQGNWSGVVKIPLPPEFRGMNESVWRQTYDHINGNGIAPVSTYAASLFDFMTGQARTNTNPVTDIVYGLASNKNLSTGGDIVPADLQGLPADQQVYDTTSASAVELGHILGVSPLKVQYVLNQFGAAGGEVQHFADQALVATGHDGGVNSHTLVGDLGNRFYGARANSDTTYFFQQVNQQRNQLTDTQDRSLFDSMFSKNSDKGYLDSAQRATILLNSLKGNGQLYSAVKAMDTYNRQNGQPGNPFYDLSPDQQLKVLVYQASKLGRDSKQDYTKNGEALFVSLGLNQPWYQQYQQAQTNFYNSITPGTLAGPTPSAPESFTGAPAPKMSDALQSWVNQYEQLPSGTGARSAALRTPMGQQYVAYLNAANDFANQERQQLGLDQLQSGSSGGSGYSSGGSSSGGSFTPHLGNNNIYSSYSSKYFTPHLTAGPQVSKTTTIGKVSVKKPGVKSGKIKVSKTISKGNPLKNA